MSENINACDLILECLKSEGISLAQEKPSAPNLLGIDEGALWVAAALAFTGTNPPILLGAGLTFAAAIYGNNRDEIWGIPGEINESFWGSDDPERLPPLSIQPAEASRQRDLEINRLLRTYWGGDEQYRQQAVQALEFGLAANITNPIAYGANAGMIAGTYYPDQWSDYYADLDQQAAEAEERAKQELVNQAWEQFASEILAAFGRNPTDFDTTVTEALQRSLDRVEEEEADLDIAYDDYENYESYQEAINHPIVQLRRDVDTLLSDIDKLQDDFTKLNEAFDSHLKAFNQLDGTVGELMTDISSVRTDLSATKADIYSRIANLASYSMNARVEALLGPNGGALSSDLDGDY